MIVDFSHKRTYCVSTQKGSRQMVDKQDHAKQKQALIAAKVAGGQQALAKVWHVVNKPNGAEAIAFLNAGPAQQAGEAFAGPGPNGSVDVYAFF
jgi:hypothetical protein